MILRVLCPTIFGPKEENDSTRGEGKYARIMRLMSGQPFEGNRIALERYKRPGFQKTVSKTDNDR